MNATLRRRLLVTAGVAAVLFAAEYSVWDGTGGIRGGGQFPDAGLLLLGVLGAVTATLTWWRPLPFGMATWAISLIAIAVPAWQPFGGVLIALFVVARLGTARQALAALGLALVTLGINTWNSAGYEGPVTATAVLVLGGLWTAVAAAVYGAGRAAHRSAGEVRELETTLRVTQEQVREQERRLIARDLHDIVANSVTAMVMRAAGARASLDADADPAISGALRDVETAGAEAVRELHRLLTTMHGRIDGVERDGGAVGLANLDPLLERVRRAGLEIDVITTGTPRRLDASSDLAAYRAVQEALSNAMRHAGAGAKVSVHIVWADALELIVANRGGSCGPPATPSGGFGLVGLSERLASVGGTLESGPMDGADGDRGYLLRATIPLSIAASGARA